MSITVSVVNFNHAHHLPACIKAIQAQSVQPAEIMVSDNASTDRSLEWLRRSGGGMRIISHTRNRGYAGAHNHAIRLSNTAYIVALNCDVILHRSFLAEMVSGMEMHPLSGSASGRLWKGQRGDIQRLDSTGLYPDRFRRFHDRDHDLPDRGQRRQPGLIFGASGSAALFRRSMLEDVAVDGEYFDEDFFAYCEDADLAWRAQRQGWDSLFVPDAQGWHVHKDNSSVHSSQRDSDARFRQLLLMRNRHLCFLKNEPLSDIARAAPWLAAYDAALQLYLTARSPQMAVRWPLSVARLIPSITRKRVESFRRATQKVHLPDWFDWERPGSPDPSCA